jgi:hypothetical protein
MINLTESRRALVARNVAALMRGWGVGVSVDAGGDSAARVDVGERDGQLTLRVVTDAGQTVAVHGRRPDLEAETQLRDAVAGRKVRTLVVVGAGLGHLVHLALDTNPEARVLVIEHLPVLAAAFLAARDWSRWAETRRLGLLVGPDYSGITDIAPRFVLDDVPPIVLSHPIVARTFGEATAVAARAARRLLSEGRQNLAARAAFARPYLLNTLANLEEILGGGRVEGLAGLGRGRPAVIAGAGPSLNRNLDELRPLRDRAVVMAAGSAMRPMIAAGVEPDLLVALDPGDANARNMAGTGVARRTWLVGEGSLPHSIFEEYRGRSVAFRVGPNHPWPWLLSLGLEPGLLRAWGSVVTSAFDLALLMECNPIIFIGCDHAYTNGQPYCRGVTWETIWEDEQRDGASIQDVWRGWCEYKGIVLRSDVHGEPIETTAHLISFSDWLVDASVRAAPVRVVNATGAGILWGGRIELGTLEGTLASAASRPLPTAEDLRTRTGVVSEARTRVTGELETLAKAESPTVFNDWAKDVPGFDEAEVRRALVAAVAACGAHAQASGR